MIKESVYRLQTVPYWIICQDFRYVPVSKFEKASSTYYSLHKSNIKMNPKTGHYPKELKAFIPELYLEHPASLR